jgi:hypothetical protein
LIAGQDHRPALIAPADELEEQIGTLPGPGYPNDRRVGFSLPTVPPDRAVS